MGLLLTLLNRESRRACGGVFRLFVSSLIELVLSALIAPILMLIQSGSVFQILLGRDTGWQPQRRDDGSIPIRDIVRRHRWHAAFGVFAGLSAYVIATSLLLWMSPTIIGLVLAIPLSWLSGSLAAGLTLKRMGLLMTPEEASPPPIADRANALHTQNSLLGLDDENALAALHADPSLRELHESLLPHRPHRAKGDFETHRVLAEAKIIDADTVEDAARWLKPKESMVVLHDRALLNLAMRLKG
jgi:membrane glycosyltransferase